MPSVLVLPDHIASQIAAGEVVERPSSVVKELVENSIDAGATQIEVAVSGECRDIRVADNGCGMAKEDAVLAFHRHATSKITSADDLWSLRTMGFRGEALPSIASVARVTCITRQHDSDTGTKIQTIDGKLTSAETGCAPGTVIEVCDLFFNVPARLKFLKKASTEFAHIHEIVQSLAIAYPKITFQLINEGEVIMRTAGSGKLAQTLVEAGFLSGKEELREVMYADTKQGTAVYGYVAAPTHFRGDRKGVLSIVNNRPVRCPLTYKALEYAYSDLIPRGKHPLAVITVTIDARQVDVNVHPTKKEIKYSNSSDIYLTIQRALVEALRSSSFQQQVISAAATSEENTLDFRPGQKSFHPQPASRAYANPQVAPTATPPEPAVQVNFSDRLSYSPPPARIINRVEESGGTLRQAARLPHGWRLLGYLKNTYFLVETEDGLEIIEQHIAHERTLYEQILAGQTLAGRISDNAQKLIISLPLNLTAEQRSCLTENIDGLRKLGFDFDLANQSSVLCTQIPTQLIGKNYETVVQKMIEDASVTDKAQFELEATKSIACQTAIKNGMQLGESDIVELLSAWHKTPRNDTCPHGRPVRLKYSMEKLFQLFHPA
jgi:DNA mismatch repair protein MutL